MRMQKLLAILLAMLVGIGWPSGATMAENEPTDYLDPPPSSAQPAVSPTPAPSLPCVPSPTPTSAPVASAQAEPTQEALPSPDAEESGTLPTDLPSDPLCSPGLESTATAEPSAFSQDALLHQPEALREAALSSSAFSIEIALSTQTSGVPATAGTAAAQQLPGDVDPATLVWVLLSGEAGQTLTLETETGPSATLFFSGGGDPGVFLCDLVCAAPDGRMALQSFTLSVKAGGPVLSPRDPAPLDDHFSIAKIEGLEQVYLGSAYGYSDSFSYALGAPLLSGADAVSWDVQQLTGKAVLTWERYAGQEVSPAGMSQLNLSCFPRQAGSSSFRVTATQKGITKEYRFTITVKALPSGLPKTTQQVLGPVTVPLGQPAALEPLLRSVGFSQEYAAKTTGVFLTPFATVETTLLEGRLHSFQFREPGRYTLFVGLQTANLTRSFHLQLIVTDGNAAPQAQEVSLACGDFDLPLPSQPVAVKDCLTATAQDAFLKPGERAAWTLTHLSGDAGELSLAENQSGVSCKIHLVNPVREGTVTYQLRFEVPGAYFGETTVTCRLLPGETPVYSLSIGLQDKTRPAQPADLAVPKDASYTIQQSGTGCSYDAALGLWVASQPGTSQILLRDKTAQGMLLAIVYISAGASPAKLALTPKSSTLSIGQALNLTPTYTGTTSLSFSSNKPAVAIVDQNGTITAIGAGTAVVTAKTHNGKAATCTITVKAAPTKVVLSLTQRFLNVGESFSLTAKAYAGTSALTHGMGQWQSDSPDTVSVSSAGRITALSLGDAAVTYRTYNGVEASCVISVRPAPDQVAHEDVSPLSVGMTYMLQPVLTAEGAPASASKLTYSVLDRNPCVTVNSAGLITAKKATPSGTPAKVRITASNQVFYDVEVSVVAAPVTGLRLTPSAATLGLEGTRSAATAALGTGGAWQAFPAETLTLVPTISLRAGGEDAPYALTYTSNRPGVARVEPGEDGSAIVTAVSTGSATITAKASNGKSAACKITVVAPPTSVRLSLTNVTLGTEESMALAPTVYCGGKALAGVQGSWHSSDPSAVSVSSQGQITALSPSASPAEITFTTYNGLTATCSVLVKSKPVAGAPAQMSLSVGMKEKVAPCFLDADGQAAHSQGSAYRIIGAKNIVSIDKSGTVTALRAGQTQLEVTAYSSTDTQPVISLVDVAVTAAPKAAFALDVKTLTLLVPQAEGSNRDGFDRYTLSPAFSVLPDVPYGITYTSSQPGIATVDAGGTITALAPGSATITAKTSFGKSATARVTVRLLPESVKVGIPQPMTVGLGESFSVSFSSHDAFGKSIPNLGSWTFLNPEGVLLQKGSTLTAAKEGSATIHIPLGHSTYAEYPVTVLPRPTSVSLSLAPLSVGMSAPIEALFLADSNPSASQKRTYKTSNASIASVDKNGMVTAKKAGKVTLTLTTYVPGVSQALAVTILPAPDRILRDNALPTVMNVGETHSLQLRCANGSPATFSCISQDPSIASVDGTGLVHALAPGSTTLLVTTHSGLSYSYSLTVE